MSLYIGDDKNKSWEELLWSLKTMDDTWGNAKLIAFAIDLCSAGHAPGYYVAWLAKCALHLSAKLKAAENKGA